MIAKKPNVFHRLYMWIRGGPLEVDDSLKVAEEQKSLMERAAMMAFIDILKERRSERRWRMVRRIGFSTFAVAMGMLSIFTLMRSHDLVPTFGKPKIMVVNIIGEIGRGEQAKSETVVPALRRAFESNTPVVVLTIDSPGGSPGDAERIADEIEILKKKHNKKLISVIGNMGASAAYLIAIHSDRIIAGNYSMVGSIGAIMTTWNVGKWPDKLTVSQEVFKSGPFKDMLNPFRQLEPVEKERAQGLVDAIAANFYEDVKKHRGTRLKAGSDKLFTGDIWTGPQAYKLGLIDEIGTMATLTNEYDTDAVSAGPNERGRVPFMAEAGESMVDGIISGLRRFSAQNQPLEVR